jgi:hypothetical protein
MSAIHIKIINGLNGLRLLEMTQYHDKTKQEISEFLDKIEKLVVALNPPKEKREHEWEFYMNGSFCKKCGAAIGSGVSCK